MRKREEIYRRIMGNSYVDGEQAETQWHTQSGGQSASDNTIWSIAEETVQEDEADFYIAWRAHEDNRRGFFSWLAGR